MLTYFLIALAASIGMLVIDWLHAGKSFTVLTNWKKYVGCLIGGLIYGLLSGLPFFRWIGVVGVIFLVGNSFSAVLVILNWVLQKLGTKAKV